ATLTTIRLRDPGFGRWDTEQVRATVREQDPASTQLAEAGLDASDVTLGFFEIFRRLTLIRAVRRLLAVEIAFGVFTIPYQTFLAFFLDERWNLGPGARGVFSAGLAIVAIAALAVFGKRGEAMFRKDPGRV